MHSTHRSRGGTRDAGVATILEDAALYIQHYGWCQHEWYEHVSGTLPRACILGAIQSVTDRPTRHDQMRYAVGYLADFLDDGIYRDDQTPDEVVWAFNDHEDTTKDLVLHALRTAAKRARVELADKAVTP